jgi:hypothetical protein
MNFSRQLSLNPEILSIAVDVYEGYARASLGEEGVGSLVIHSSCLTIAASYAAVIDQERSKRLFGYASQAYHKQGHSPSLAQSVDPEGEHRTAVHQGKMAFARFLAVCSTELRQVQRLLVPHEVGREAFHSPDSLASVLISQTMVDLAAPQSGPSIRHQAMEEAHRMRSYEVGRLGLPLSHFLRLAEIPDELDRARAVLPELASGVLSRAEDTMVAVTQSPHWKFLQSSMLPVEPELLAFCIALNRATRKATRSELNLLSMLGDHTYELAGAYAQLAVAFENSDDRPKNREPLR